eukprot:795462-Amphidinium_carterae.1
MKAHQTQAAVDCGTVTAVDLHGNAQADVLANPGLEWSSRKPLSNSDRLRTQDCRKLSRKSVKVRPAGVLAPEVRRIDLGGSSSDGETISGSSSALLTNEPRNARSLRWPASESTDVPGAALPDEPAAFSVLVYVGTVEGLRTAPPLLLKWLDMENYTTMTVSSGCKDALFCTVQFSSVTVVVALQSLKNGDKADLSHSTIKIS